MKLLALGLEVQGVSDDAFTSELLRQEAADLRPVQAMNRSVDVFSIGR